MDAYTSFAKVYDLFMDNVPYEMWSEYIIGKLKEYGIDDGLVLDLGCGTGKMTSILQKRGYDMIGVDNSMDMLEIARESSSEGILYLLQDMREFELFGTVRAVYSACDSLNYILEKDDLLTVFKLVNNYLDAGGIFIFDINTRYKYQELMGENTFAENREDGSFIWENYYDEVECINQYDLTLFLKEEDRDSYLKFSETHFQKCYTLEEIKELLEEAGMDFIGAYDGYTDNPVSDDSEKITIIARESAAKQKNKYYTEE